jgi:hypothetical protein
MGIRIRDCLSDMGVVEQAVKKKTTKTNCKKNCINEL